MKKILAVLAVFVSVSAMAQLKVGFVDSQRLLDTMPSRKAALEKYQAYEKDLADEFQLMREDLQKAYEKYEADLPNMTPVLRQAAEKKIMDKEKALQERQQTIPMELQAYSDELNGPILDKVQNAVKIVSERKKLSYVVDQTTTLYFSPELDITGEVAVELLKLDAAAAGSN